MLKGAPQTLSSHFKLSYHLLLELIQQGKRPTPFSQKSLIQNDVQSEISGIQRELTTVRANIAKLDESIKHIRTPPDVVREYIALQKERPNTVNKKRKDIDRRIQTIKDDNRFIDTDVNTITVYDETIASVAEKEERLAGVEQYVESTVDTTIGLLERRGFLLDGSLTSSGYYAAALKEVHCLVFAGLLDVRYFENKDLATLVEMFSCFTNVSVQEQFKETSVPDEMRHICNLYDEYMKEECQLKINSGIEYELQYDLVPYMREWCESTDVAGCKWVLQKMMAEKGIFLGEFVKALLKINNIAIEIGSIAEKMGDIALLAILKAIPDATLKFVVTNQSLYV